MDDRVHDSLHTMSAATKKVLDAVEEWGVEVSKFYILIEELCREDIMGDGLKIRDVAKGEIVTKPKEEEKKDGEKRS